MEKEDKTPDVKTRNRLAYGTMIFSVFAITFMAVFAIAKGQAKTMDIFNVVLPLFATWVGTILAFYFGRENFEAANQEVRKLVDRLTPEERAKVSVSSIMRRMSDIEYYQIPKGKGDKDVKLSELSGKYNDKVSRLPIIDGDGKVKYIIHEASINKYIAEGGKKSDTLETFIVEQEKKGIGFGLNKGFILVSEDTTLAAAKSKLGETPSIQDIFVTKGGTPDEPLTGWISNVRLAKFLQA